MDYNLKIVVILTIGFSLASVLGYLMQRIKLPSILGYLLAGYIIGPFSPGFVADIGLAEQLAEVGVILMLFGVGLHFKLQDLNKVKRIAIPGAIGQTTVAALTGTFFVHFLGWSLESGVIIGLAIGVASTVVLMRVLSDNHLLDTVQGHIAVGWLIVEDIFTVAALILLPMLAQFSQGITLSFTTIASTLVLLVLKFVLLAVIMFKWGHKVVSYVLTMVARLRSHELFTLSVLAAIFIIATGSAFIFGTSIALGAFIAGMVIGQSDLRHQASANSLPLKDVFGVVFFLSVGMLFNPAAISEHTTLFVGILGIILFIKPLTALLIVLLFRYPLKTAFTVAIALAQIGEFSFILAEEALNLHLLPSGGYDILVACALVSISLNPLLFKALALFESKGSGAKKSLFLHTKLLKNAPPQLSQLFEQRLVPKVIVVGFGPIGKVVVQTLRNLSIKPIVIDQNIDTVVKQNEGNEGKGQDIEFIYGDASQVNILESAHIMAAKLLISTIPESNVTISIINSARHLNSNIRILCRVRYAAEQALLEELHVDHICCEVETSKTFAEVVAHMVRYT